MESTYNDFSKIQSQTISGTWDMVIKSCDKMIDNIKSKNERLSKLNSNENPNVIRILDIGSSHGRNSIMPINLIISNVLKQFPSQCFEVYHEDLPENNFSLLFKEISDNENSYIKLSNQIYFYAIGNSFYNQLVPSNSIDYVFSFSASHWDIYNDSFHYDKVSIGIIYKERSKEYKKYCIDNLYKNFSLRAKELKKGGIFLVTIINENECTNVENDSLYQLFCLFKTLWREIANENLISFNEVEKMAIPINVYKKDEVYDAIKLVETDHQLKLVTIEQNVQKFSDSHSLFLSDQEKSEILFSTMNAACESSLKNFIKGDQNTKDSLYKLFISKFLNHIKVSPLINIDYLFSYYSIIFEKIC
ncbi:hypothetical protein RB653_003528 [Dictyostelium firmibasis]|uniref:SAM dependent carboxyl methyltransferase n=1 Tax=Dictyostelium firmibasis TaxID=79012 RepID=A0AAN7YZ69_9MYCE